LPETTLSGALTTISPRAPREFIVVLQQDSLRPP